MRRRRHGVDRVGGDQLFDIEHVAVVLVLGPGACPKQPLHPCALGTKLLPTRSSKEPLVALVGELRVGDRDLAPKFAQRAALLRILGLGQALLDQFVDRNVDAADEEAGDACNPARIAASAQSNVRGPPDKLRRLLHRLAARTAA